MLDCKTTHALRLMEKRVAQKTRQVIEVASELSLVVHELSGARVIDFAVKRSGSIEAGLALAEICLSGLGQVQLLPGYSDQMHLPGVAVRTDWPLIACIASQYAGWPFSTDDYFAMCSGPARVNRGQEPILRDYQLKGHFTPAVGIFESNSLPKQNEIAEFSTACQIQPSEALICVARTASFPGMIQVVARSIETAMHKLHELKFDLSTVISGSGIAPLPPLVADDLQALGWTNDAILYGAVVNLWLDTTDEAIESVLDHLPSNRSADFGVPFLEIFERYQRDFYKIDKLLFSPARVILNNLRTGRVFACGEIRTDILKTSFRM